VRIALLAVAVGSVVTALAEADGGGSCASSRSGSGLARSSADTVCFQLVRTLATRMGLVTAAATAIVVLMMVGLSRLSASERSIPPR
jgi:hypothetical protein